MNQLVLLYVRLLAWFGHVKSRRALRLWKQRRLELGIFLATLTPEQRRLSRRRLLQKFNHKYPPIG